MAKAVTGPGRTVFGKGGTPGRTGSEMSAPKSVGYRVHPVPHSKAPEAKTSDSIYPGRPQNAGVATAAIGSKTFAK